MQFCGEPGCGSLVVHGRCATHTQPARYTRSGFAETHRWTRSSRWQRLRVEVLQDEPFCRHCRAQGRKTFATDVDHVVKHDGDPIRFWDRANLQALCRTCHSTKTARGG